MNTERNVGIDLLRIVSMLMVVSLHYLGKGNLLEKSGHGVDVYVVAWLLERLSIAAVNTYVLISGYLLCKKPFRSGRIVKLWLQTFVYSAGILLVMMLPIPGGHYHPTLHGLLTAFFPITMDHYWFMTAYMIMVLFSPLLNLAIWRLDRKQHLMVICLMLGLFSLPKSILPVRLEFDDLGYSGLWFLVVYVIAAYLRRIREEDGNAATGKKAGKYLGIYLIFVAGMWMLTLTLGWISEATGHLEEIWKLPMEYNFLLNIGAAVCLFLFFSHLQIRQGLLCKIISFAASYTLGVYLLHEHVLIRYEWPKWLFADRIGNAGALIACWLLAILIVFAAGILLDHLRELLFGCIGKTRGCQYLKGKLAEADARLEIRE